LFICFLRYRAVFGETAEKDDIESEKIDGTKLEPERSWDFNLHADEEQNNCKYRNHDHVSELIFGQGQCHPYYQTSKFHLYPSRRRNM
jgi:hypothetical protein